MYLLVLGLDADWRIQYYFLIKTIENELRIMLFKIGTIDKPRYYKGRRDMAVDGLHEAIVPLVKGHTVLDLGSGDGALAERLRDTGHNVEESDDVDFDVHGWSEIYGKYDSVISIEVIEHLKSSWNFINEASELVKPGGQLLISTPNIENPISKLIFLLRGQYFLFRQPDLSYGHISPLTEFQIKTIAEANGLKLINVVRAGTYPIIYVHRNAIDTLLWSTIALTALPLSKNQSPCKIYDCRKEI